MPLSSQASEIQFLEARPLVAAWRSADVRARQVAALRDAFRVWASSVEQYRPTTLDDTQVQAMDWLRIKGFTDPQEADQLWPRWNGSSFPQRQWRCSTTNSLQ